jgi:hypothetical protein
MELQDILLHTFNLVAGLVMWGKHERLAIAWVQQSLRHGYPKITAYWNLYRVSQ